MPNVKIDVVQIEFNEGGNTLWVHGPQGNTVFRLKVSGKITGKACTTSPDMGSHADLMADGDLVFCLGNDAGVGDG